MKRQLKMFNKSTFQEMAINCSAKYPEEACGVVFKNGDVICMENIQNKLHQLDPAVYSRNSTNGYSISINDIKIIETSLDTNNPVITIYHSHPDVGAYFSREDEAKALYYGELIFPVNYLVFDVQKGKVIEAKLFEYSNKKFECVSVYNGKYISQTSQNIIYYKEHI